MEDSKKHQDGKGSIITTQNIDLHPNTSKYYIFNGPISIFNYRRTPTPRPLDLDKIEKIDSSTEK